MAAVSALTGATDGICEKCHKWHGIEEICRRLWKPRVRRYRENDHGDRYYVAFVYKGRIERRVNDHIKMSRQSAWDNAFAAAVELNKIESTQA